MNISNISIYQRLKLCFGIMTNPKFDHGFACVVTRVCYDSWVMTRVGYDSHVLWPGWL